MLDFFLMVIADTGAGSANHQSAFINLKTDPELALLLQDRFIMWGMLLIIAFFTNRATDSVSCRLTCNLGVCEQYKSKVYFASSSITVTNLTEPEIDNLPHSYVT